MTLTASIQYFGKPCVVACDGNCGKAWGINQRPRAQVTSDPDDYSFLADSELGEAPSDPGTYEGLDAKPLTTAEFPNRWCVRECERCWKGDPGEEVRLSDFGRRVYNVPRSPC